MTSHSGQEITLSAALIWLQLCAIFFLANVIFNVSHHDSGRERRKYQFVLYHSYGQTLTERQQWVQNRNEKAPSGCHFMVLLWKSLPSGWMQNVGGINDMWYRRGEGADSCAFGREGWRGGNEDIFRESHCSRRVSGSIDLHFGLHASWSPLQSLHRPEWCSWRALLCPSTELGLQSMWEGTNTNG